MMGVGPKIRYSRLAELDARSIVTNGRRSYPAWKSTQIAGDHHHAKSRPTYHTRPGRLRPAALCAGSQRIGAGRTGNDRPSGRAHVRCDQRSEEHTSELQSLMRTSYAVFCLTKKQ